MQRVLSRKSSIQQFYGLAAAVFAAGALSVCAPALAAPNGDAPTISNSEIILADKHKATGNREQGKDLDRSRKMEKNETRANRADDDRDDDDRNWDRSSDGEPEDEDRHWSRGDDGDREGSWRRDHRGQADGRHDRGNHYGWERGKHRGWDKKDGHSGYGGDRLDNREDWRAERQESHWVGRSIGRVDSQVMRDYLAYGLPQPGEGQYYARSDNEVYLVTERTQRIQDAFVLRNSLR